jgi:hypothetical protein
MLSMAPDRIVRRPSCQARTRNTGAHRSGGHTVWLVPPVVDASFSVPRWWRCRMEIVPSRASGAWRLLKVPQPVVEYPLSRRGRHPGMLWPRSAVPERAPASGPQLCLVSLAQR